MSNRRGMATTAAILALAGAGAAGIAISIPQTQEQQAAAQQGRQDAGGLPDLVAGLKATEGCVDVTPAQTMGGQQVLFAWFEDKRAVLRWYYSDMHEQVAQAFFPQFADSAHKPLEHIEADSGPLMVIASITYADKPQLEQTTLPISQIAIEIYKPMPGGLSLGGAFTPDKIEVPHHQRIRKPADK